MGWITWISARYIYDIFTSGRQSSLLQVPLWRVWIIVPIGLGLTTIHYAMAFLKNVKEDEVWISFDEKSEYGEVEQIIDLVEESEDDVKNTD